MRKLICITPLLCLVWVAQAQQRKEKDLFKKFMNISHGYKFLPLQLHVLYEESSNFPATASSKKMQGQFYMNKESSYIKFGNIEQVISDSAILMVMQDTRHMRMMFAAVNIDEQLKKAGSPSLKDSAMKNLNRFYNANEKDDADGRALLRLASKSLLYSTDLSTDEMEVLYNKKTGEPLKLTTVKRSLVPKPADSAAGQASGIREVFVEGKGRFLVKETRTFFSYLKIEHRENEKNPVLLSDRVMKSENGTYTPVAGYNEYTLIQ